MKLTELKNRIDEALQLHSDYDVVIDGLEIEGCEIGPGRFNFNIEVNEEGCQEYHIEEDDNVVYCSTCDIYYPSGKDCPGCKFKKIKESVKKSLLPF